MRISILKQVLFEGIQAIRMTFFSSRIDKYGYIHPTSKVYQPTTGAKQNVYLYENTVIHEGARFVTSAGAFTMKKNSTASFNLTVITFLHQMGVNDMPNANEGNYTSLIPSEVVVDEGVLMGANVTLLPGAHIQRGTIVGAGSVVTRSSVHPPYSVIGGNPARFIKFRLSLEEQILHEQHFYNDEERISIDILKDNYNRYNYKNC